MADETNNVLALGLQTLGGDAAPTIATRNVGGVHYQLVLAGGFLIPLHDFREYAYAGGLLQTIKYRVGGAAGDIVATITHTYDGDGNIATQTVDPLLT